MTIQLYNTLTRAKEPFVPADPNRVTMYVCGPTVYNFAHIGNARPAVVFDVLFRLLSRHFDDVVYARNITDLDDKINKAALEEGVGIDVISVRYTAAYHQDMAALGTLPPTVEPRATEHISQMIAMIEALIASGHAYEGQGHVLFHVPSYAEYSRLSRQGRDDILEGARIDVAPYKKDGADFVIWKPSTEDQPGWDSPWGWGRPGWHLECSAMVETHLGRTIDLHGGGNDLVFPHHENEIAQSTCAHSGELYSRHWVHNGFVNVDHEKMSKSLGNVLLVRDLLSEAPGEAIRMALLTAHYRKPLDWSGDTLPQAKRELDRLYGPLRTLSDVAPAVGEDMVPQGVIDALKDDLNTPLARAALFDIAGAANVAVDPDEQARLKAMLLAGGKMLGLLQQDPEDWFSTSLTGDGPTEQAIALLIKERDSARHQRDFKRADEIRDNLLEQGVVLEDGADGTTWRRQ